MHLNIYISIHLHIYISIHLCLSMKNGLIDLITMGPKRLRPTSHSPLTSFHTGSDNIVVRLPSTYTRPPYPGATPSFNPPHCRRSLAPAALVVVALSVCEPHFIRVPGPRSAGDLSPQPSLPSLSPCRAAACRADKTASWNAPLKLDESEGCSLSPW